MRIVRVVKKRGPNVMFLPVVSAEDGYGLTYGAQFAVPDPIGKNSRLAFPATWAFVTMFPDRSSTTPEPSPFSVLISTTEGSTWRTTLA